MAAVGSTAKKPEEQQEFSMQLLQLYYGECPLVHSCSQR